MGPHLPPAWVSSRALAPPQSLVSVCAASGKDLSGAVGAMFLFFPIFARRGPLSPGTESAGCLCLLSVHSGHYADMPARKKQKRVCSSQLGAARIDK